MSDPDVSTADSALYSGYSVSTVAVACNFADEQEVDLPPVWPIFVWAAEAALRRSSISK
jgi:hypothetical protein